VQIWPPPHPELGQKDATKKPVASKPEGSPPVGPPPEREGRMQRWQEAKFGGCGRRGPGMPFCDGFSGNIGRSLNPPFPSQPPLRFLADSIWISLAPAGRMRHLGSRFAACARGPFRRTTGTPQILHSWLKKGEALANMPGLRLRLFVCDVQGFRSIGIIRIESQYFAQFHNSILPATEPA
jgi:hypothetical protein